MEEWGWLCYDWPHGLFAAGTDVIRALYPPYHTTVRVWYEDGSWSESQGSILHYAHYAEETYLLPWLVHYYRECLLVPDFFGNIPLHRALDACHEDAHIETVRVMLREAIESKQDLKLRENMNLFESYHCFKDDEIVRTGNNLVLYMLFDHGAVVPPESERMEVEKVAFLRDVYNQREACRAATRTVYGIMRRWLGRDLAGEMARYVWATRQYFE